jgi:hypothetical protein
MPKRAAVAKTPTPKKSRTETAGWASLVIEAAQKFTSDEGPFAGLCESFGNPSKGATLHQALKDAVNSFLQKQGSAKSFLTADECKFPKMKPEDGTCVKSQDGALF